MKKVLSAMLVLLAAGCDVPMDEGEVEVDSTEQALTPRTTFTRTIPGAPSSARPVQWTPGMALVPAGYTPRSFWVVFVGKQGSNSIVEAAGFDVAGHRSLFWVEMSVNDVPLFVRESNDTVQVLGLQRSGHGIAGNVTPKCCILPGTGFHDYAWGTAYVLHEANEAIYR